LHSPSGHAAHGPQSAGHPAQSSIRSGSHAPLPQPGHAPQSSGQLKQDSPPASSHVPSPQSAHGPQSRAQLEHVSPMLGEQIESPQSSIDISGGRMSPRSRVPPSLVGSTRSVERPHDAESATTASGSAKERTRRSEDRMGAPEPRDVVAANDSLTRMNRGSK